MPWKTITRKELYDEVWSTPVSKLAPKYNLSDVGFAKFCKRCDIPRPPRGYWAKLEAGQANNFEELVPLVDLCRAGKLFEVQAWIAESKPVNPPSGHYRGSRKKTPIEYAIDAGFHSLVKVLLDAGADVGPIDRYCPMTMALEKRRLDIVKLLVEHGYDPTGVDARRVLATWDVEIMEYFVESGCNMERRNPVAWALCNRIRTSLPLVKKYHDRFPSIREQVNIALRYHCKEGDAKWVSLMLWAGADPLCRGEEDPDREPDLEDGGLSALGFAARYNHYGLFELKGIKACLSNPAAADILDHLLGSDATPVLASMLDRGLDPNNNPRGGCTAIQQCLERFHRYGSGRDAISVPSQLFPWRPNHRRLLSRLSSC